MNCSSMDSPPQPKIEEDLLLHVSSMDGQCHKQKLPEKYVQVVEVSDDDDDDDNDDDDDYEDSSHSCSNKLAAYDNDQTSKRCTTKRGRIDFEAHPSASNSTAEHRRFIKTMRRTHVSQHFVMAVPEEFYRLHMPNTHNAEVILEDENGKRYTAKIFSGQRKRFNSGWKVFAVAHKLVEGDSLDFHLIGDCHFKVHIKRVNHQIRKRKCKAADKEGPGFAPHQDTVQGSDHANTEELHLSDQEADPFEKSRNIEEIKCTLSGSDFDKFRIKVNNEIIDHKLSRKTRFKYYQLCCSRKSCLHDNLLQNVNPKLAAEIVEGTLKVADDIRAYKLSTSETDVDMWTSTLEGFEKFGMEVGFLVDRLKRLAGVAAEYRKTVETKRGVLKEEITKIEMKFRVLGKAADKLESEMKTLAVDAQKYDGHLQEEANAPW